MAWRTRSAVSAVTFSEPLIVRETVAVDTLASRATSFMFISDDVWPMKRLYRISHPIWNRFHRQAKLPHRILKIDFPDWVRTPKL
jgi:hypothetical protein